MPARTFLSILTLGRIDWSRVNRATPLLEQATLQPCCSHRHAIFFAMYSHLLLRAPPFLQPHDHVAANLRYTPSFSPLHATPQHHPDLIMCRKQPGVGEFSLAYLRAAFWCTRVAWLVSTRGVAFGVYGPATGRVVAPHKLTSSKYIPSRRTTFDDVRLFAVRSSVDSGSHWTLVREV